MRHVAACWLAAMLLVAPSCGGHPAARAAAAAPRAGAPIDDWTWLSDVAARRREPFRIFDNIAYVGLDWVACYLVETSDGLILIDSLYEPHMETLLANIRLMGHDPAAVAYVVVTHGHWDHAGGARFLQQQLGARIIMAAADWDLVQAQPGSGNTRFLPPAEDLVLGDRESLTLGDTTLVFHLTPGHTAGTLSVEFPARDGGATWRALTYGGVGIDFSDPARLRTYMDSVERIRERGPFQVNLTNHPGMGRVFALSRELAMRPPGAPHPFVNPQAMDAWLDGRLAAALEALPAP